VLQVTSEFCAIAIGDIMLKFSVVTELDEMLSLESLARDALAESRFSYFDFSPEKFERLARTASSDVGRHGVLVAKVDDKPVGFVYCTIGGLAIGDGPLITTVTMFFVKDNVRTTLLGGKASYGLLTGLESWTKSRGGHEVLFHANFGRASERIHGFLKRCGFEVLGGSYARRL
jgi:hypothetical protein